MRTEDEAKRLIRDTIQWYTGVKVPPVVHIEDWEPWITLNEVVTEMAWWISLELVFGETCPRCWAVGSDQPCTRECFSCWDHHLRCDHHGGERWPSPGHRTGVLVRMASEVSRLL